ncbi:MAG: DUF3095 domain-containing protein [Gammaproteobacteria bacterium]|nr:DUF3095 domain-containing protein [Gammaproteobacteria bacterium]
MHTHFYQQLKPFSRFSDFTVSGNYADCPQEWFVVITDVKGSTRAIERGDYKVVNSLGVASIMAVLNAVKTESIPFVFGGDGASFCIPPDKADVVRSALVATRIMAEEQFDLELRIGMVPVKTILDAGEQIRIAKYQVSEHYQQAMFRGGGLGYAEALVKDPSAGNPYLVNHEEIEPVGDFHGFECRWNEIPTPHEETIALLIQAVEEDESSRDALFMRIHAKIREIYGAAEEHRPVRAESLSLTFSLQQLAGEIAIRTAFKSIVYRIFYTTRLLFVLLAGKYMMAKGVQTDSTDWGSFKESLVASSDYRKFDEVLRMIIAGTRQQREALCGYLNRLQKTEKVAYGIHCTTHALMTCAVFDYGNEHVHFLDASDGGYAMAARELKQQLTRISGHNT